MLSTSMALQVGDKAPEFTTTDTNGNKVTLPKRGIVVLYFYPRDDTPGCTKEACNIRDNYKRLQEKKITIYGVSTDDEASHQKFTQKFNLSFPLLADTSKDIVEKYSVYVEKNMYGKKYMGIKRTTFVIKNGTVHAIISKVDVSNHTKQILETL